MIYWKNSVVYVKTAINKVDNIGPPGASSPYLRGLYCKSQGNENCVAQSNAQI